MIQMSDVLHRLVISRKDSSVIGEIRDVYFDENCKNIVYFALLCDGREYLLPLNAVASFSDAVMVEDGLPLLSVYDIDKTELLHGLSGRPVFTVNGRSKGVLEDASFSARGRVASLKADGSGYSPASFKAFGEVLLLNDTPVRPRRKKTSFPSASEDRTVTILSPSYDNSADGTRENGRSAAHSDTPDSAAAADLRAFTPPTNGTATASDEAGTASPKPERLDVNAETPSDDGAVYLRDAVGGIEVLFAQDDFTPHRIIADYNFLLGRTLSEDIRTYVGEKIASKGETVTVETVEKARRNGKLIELTLNSK